MIKSGTFEESKLSGAILLITSCVLLGWFWYYFTDGPVASVDLPSHIALADRYRDFWWRGQWFFYDRTTFTGYTALQFYGFFPVALTTWFSYLVAPFSADAVRFSAHLLLMLGVAALPWSFHACMKALLRHLELPKGGTVPPAFSALVSVFASCWFINHDHQWYGIGAAAVMNIGLFAQLFAWHFLLRLVAGTFNELSGKRSVLWLWWGLLLVTHLITAFFAAAFLLFCFCWFTNLRRSLTRHLMLGTGSVAFWLLPCITYLGEYTAYDVYRPKGDFLELFYRYPLWGIGRALASALEGAFSQLEVSYFVWLGCTLALFSVRRFVKSQAFSALLIFLLLSLLVFSSGFVATSLPLGLHYYRFLGLIFLLWTLLLASVFAGLWGTGDSHRWWNRILLVVPLICIVSVARFPHYERAKIQNHRTHAYLNDQEAVLQYFAGLPDKGRVYIEYLADYSIYPPLTAHYIASNLWRRTGFESGVSSHLQESLAYRTYVASAHLLGAKTYNVPLLFVEKATGDDAVHIEQLREFGFTHLVGAREEFVRRIVPFATSEPRRFGIYTVVPIAEPPLNLIAPVEKTPVGYYDSIGVLPFAHVQYYFHSRASLSKNFELIALEDLTSLPEGLALVIINQRDQATDRERKDGIPRLSFEFNPSYTLRHYDVHYPHNIELDAYRAMERFFDGTFKLAPRIRTATKDFSSRPVSSRGRMEVVGAGQKFLLGDLQPGLMYRLNYSYAPFWTSADGRVLRGQGERLFFLPRSTVATITFSPWSEPTVWCGALLSFCTWVVLMLGRRRARRSAMFDAPEVR